MLFRSLTFDAVRRPVLSEVGEIGIFDPAPARIVVGRTFLLCPVHDGRIFVSVIDDV